MSRTKKANTARMYTIDKSKLRELVKSSQINNKRINQEQISILVFHNKSGYKNFMAREDEKELSGQIVKNFCDVLNIEADEIVLSPQKKVEEFDSPNQPNDITDWMENIYRIFSDFRRYDCAEFNEKILELLESIDRKLELINDNEKCLLDEWRGGRND